MKPISFFESMKVHRTCMISLLALGLSCLSQPALAQTESENSARIAELENKIEALRARNEELVELVRSLIGETPSSGAPARPTDEAVSAAVEEDKVERLASSSEADLLIQSAQKTGNVNLYVERAFQTADAIPFLADGSISAPSRKESSAVGILANADGGRVAVTLNSSSFKSYVQGKPVPRDCTLRPDDTVRVSDPCNDTPTKYRQDETSLSFSAPAGKSGTTSFATLDGLATGTKAEFRRTIYFGDIPKVSTLFATTVVETARSRCLLLNAKTPEKCTTLDADFMEKYMLPGDRDSFADAMFDGTMRNSFGFTLSGAIGYDKYPYFPDTRFNKEEAERLSGSFGAGLIYFPDRGTSFSFEGQYQHTFKAADDATRCRTEPDDGADFLACVTGAFDKPSKTNKFIIAPQYRSEIPLPANELIPRVAIAPRLEYDLLSDDYAIDVPLFLVADKDEGIVAGIRFGYEQKSDDGDFKFGVFYGKAFDLTPF